MFEKFRKNNILDNQDERVVKYINDMINYWMSENGTSIVLKLLEEMKENPMLLETLFPEFDWSKLDKKSILNKLSIEDYNLEEENKKNK